MAEGATYPASFLDTNGNVREGQVLRFDDDTNQPGGAVPEPPFHAAATGSTPIMVDTPDGDPVISFDADAGEIDLAYKTAINGDLTTQGLHASGAVQFDASVAATGDLATGTDGTSVVGFYGATPVAQAAAPVTLGDVIAALKALGLVAT